MIRTIFMRLIQILDFFKTNDLTDFFKQVIYLNRKAIIIENNLDKVNNKWMKRQESDIMFEEITTDTFLNKKYLFLTKNRYHKTVYYLKEGYRGHAVVKGEVVIGEIWYSATKKNDIMAVNPDVNTFGITAAEDHAYSFDQFVAPNERGNNVAAALVNFQLYSLKEKGYKKAFGFYWADNIPAVWNNKVMNNYKETKTLSVYGSWFFKIALNKED